VYQPVEDVDIFWVATPCGLVGRYQYFRETYCLHVQGYKFLYLQVHMALQLRRPSSTA
jgi:hypothetical protein